MQFGVQMFPTDYAIPVTELGKAVEDAGFESLSFPEHTHIPASRLSAWPGGAELPMEYSHTLDPFVALGAVAGVTKTLRLGTGICLVIERDTITLAKEVASLDHVSGGRVLFGIGGGWNREEMENHGTHWPTRWRRLREQILAMKEIWTQDNAEYHGKYVNFDPIWSWPKPVQKPHPPVIIGGDGPGTFARVVEYGDGWMPIGGRANDGRTLEEKIEDLQSQVKAAGRGRVEISIFGVGPRPELLERYAKAGVDRCVFGLPPAPADKVLPMVERYRELVRSFTG
jgi:probable F420-dependent oxidoreductase